MKQREKNTMTTLIHIPIIHDPFKDLLDIQNKGNKRVIGEKEREAFDTEYNQCWNRIDTYLQERLIDKIYQDGTVDIPGMDVSIEHWSAKGSRNAQTIATLLERGARLVPVENYMEVMLGMIFSSFGIYTDGMANCRDKPIADGIGRTLAENENGVLFLGWDHVLAPHYLRVDYPHINVEEFDAGFEKPYAVLENIMEAAEK